MNKQLLLSALCSVIPLILIAQEDIKLRDYQPRSIYNTPTTEVERAKFPVIDFHSHPYATSEAELKDWVATLKKANIKKTVILTYATGKQFDSIYDMYAKYGDVFELWCGIDYTGYNQPGWPDKAIKELVRCYSKGARGVGELGDKGFGMFYSKPTQALGMHFNDDRLLPVLEKCGQLNMPVSIHVADPYWMYLPINAENDGLMNAQTWKIDTDRKGLLLHKQLIETLSDAVEKNPNTTFIACHFANSSHNLDILAQLFEKHDNLYADISARYAEIAPVPRRTKAFMERFSDRLVYGTDMGMDYDMYQTTFRILETEDEHFYNWKYFSYHWPLHALDLSESTLQKIYQGNGQKILNR